MAPEVTLELPVPFVPLTMLAAFPPLVPLAVVVEPFPEALLEG